MGSHERKMLGVGPGTGYYSPAVKDASPLPLSLRLAYDMVAVKHTTDLWVRDVCQALDHLKTAVDRRCAPLSAIPEQAGVARLICSLASDPRRSMLSLESTYFSGIPA